ncbi:Polysaccharide deacetylase [Methylomagnum ishizawai]|uniref:Polysaccharide deacetylase n=1 Tax=Methylomagnum ishizawai TaxID=1760988 RepID=A0A1Y6CWX2_9GAMM|nr:polysaccharide deacetylase family protein [Methylomagnum ishizawai]SMF94740.1 Polysaccharide deacetylase [Methylomagnum ishizawai]
MSLWEAAYRLAARGLSPAGGRARLSILIYHRVLPEADPLFPGETTAAGFDLEMGLLKRVFAVLPLGEAVARLKAGTLPARAACVTFDDGYADNATHALPILRKYGLPACFFIATAYLDGGRMFNDTVIEAVRRAKPERVDLGRFGLGEHDLSSPEAKARAIGAILSQVKYLPPDRREDTVAGLAAALTGAALPTDLMLTTAQLQALRQAGMDIGAHTHRHPILAKLDPAAVRAEIAEGVAALEGILDQRVGLFAYPNGKPGSDYLPQQAAIVRELGFDAAVSTQWGAACAASDPFQLPRFTPWSRDKARFQPQLLRNLVRSYF